MSKRKPYISWPLFNLQWWATLVFLLLSLNLLSSCTATPITLSLVVTQDEVGYWPPLIKAFETQYPDVQINYNHTQHLQEPPLPGG